MCLMVQAVLLEWFMAAAVLLSWELIQMPLMSPPMMHHAAWTWWRFGGGPGASQAPCKAVIRHVRQSSAVGSSMTATGLAQLAAHHCTAPARKDRKDH
jgi:hypothetical protein